MTVKKESIDKEMFTEIRDLFPNFDYSSEIYEKFWEHCEIFELFKLAYQQFCESTGFILRDYGNQYRNSTDPEIGKDFKEIERMEDTLYSQFFKIFDLFLKYKRYLPVAHNMPFSQFIENLITQV